MAAHRQPTNEIGNRTIATITRRLMPLLGLMYLIAYIDRQNVSYAKLQMVGDLGLSETAYGLGASLFFIGYFIFEVPSNVILERVGARLWFARIMVSWGLVTLLLGFTQNPTMFYVLRFLLGACEAGFFPGVLYALTLWFPQDSSRPHGRTVHDRQRHRQRDRCRDRRRLARPRRPLWAARLAVGVPRHRRPRHHPCRRGRSSSCRIGRSRPAGSSRKARLGCMACSRPSAPDADIIDHANPFRVLLDRRVQLLALLFVAFPLSAYGLSYWLPTVVKGFGVSNTTNGFLNIIPWLAVALALWWNPRHAARTGEQTWHIVVPALLGAACLILSVLVPGNALKFAFLCVAAAGIFAGQPVFWTLPPTSSRAPPPLPALPPSIRSVTSAASSPRMSCP